MANALWPAALPQHFFLGAGLQDGDDDVIRQEMDGGIAKLRRRYTASVGPARITETLILTDEQAYKLRTFYRSTLSKVLPFDWKNPISGTAETYRFYSGPTFNLITGGAEYNPAFPGVSPSGQALFQCTIQLEAVDSLT